MACGSHASDSPPWLRNARMLVWRTASHTESNLMGSRMVGSRRDQPGIPHVVGASALSGLAYTALIIAAAQRPDGPFGKIVQTWVAFTERFVELALFLAPSPNTSADPVLLDRITAYRHLIVACSLIAVGIVLSTRTHWPYWAERLRARLGVANKLSRPAELVLVSAYRTTILGIIAVALLMLFGEPKGARATTLLYATDWAFLRAPILGAVACCLCCHAGALRHCLMHRQ
jgi:hypothetical protein